jgi:ACS family tartrate transporter-like MFS transporter
MTSTYDPTDAFQRETLRKVTWRLVPMLTLMYTTAYLDRINIGTAALTMNKDLGISQALFGLVGSLFLVGYFLLEIPSNVAFVRFGARVWLTRIMISWGVISCMTAFVQTPGQLIAVRIALGIAEAGFFPGLILYITLWFPKEVRARVFFLSTLPFAVVLGAPASTAIIQYTDGWFGFAGWRIMFFIEGLPPILLGLVTARYLTSLPAQAMWLTPQQREWIGSIAEVSDGVRHSVRESLGMMFRNRSLLLYAVAYGLLQMGFYAGLIFTPQIISSFSQILGTKLSLAQVGLLTATPSLVAAAVSYIWARHSDRTGERVWHAAIGAAAGAVGISISLTASGIVGLMAGLTILQCGLLCGLIPLWQLPTRGLSSSSAAVVIAAVNSFGILGSFISPLVIGWMKDASGTYSTGLSFIAVMLLLAAVLVLVAGTIIEKRQRISAFPTTKEVQ